MNDTVILQRLEAALARLPRGVILLLIAAAVFAAWGRSLSYPFVWDDDFYIVKNEALRSPSEWTRYFTDAEAQKSAAPYPYRALRTLHYGLMTWPFGRPVPGLFHLANLLWQAGVSFLVFQLALRIFRRVLPEGGEARARLAALFSALAFAVHPVAAEVVCWAKSLDDLMGTFFLLASFVFAWDAWSEGRRGRGRLALASVACFALALWSKESVVGLVFLFLFPVLVFPSVPRAAFAAWFLAQGAVLAVFLLIRNAVLQYLSQVSVPLSGTYGQTLVDTAPSLLRYVKSMLGIPPFHPDYSFLRPGHAMLSAPVLGGLAVLGLGLAAMAWALRHPRRRLVLWFSLAWIGLALIPVSNAVPMMQYFAERFVYLPLAGFVLLAGYVFGRAAGRIRHAPIYALAVIALWGASAAAESAKWKSELSLWRYAYGHAPALGDRIVVNYAAALNDAGAFAEVDDLLARHADLVEMRARGRWIVAQRAWARGDRKDALRRMIELEPELKTESRFMTNLGVLYAETGDPGKGLGYLETATGRWPSDANAWANFGVCLASLDRHGDAIRAFERAVELDPQRVTAWKGLSASAWAAKDWPTAERAFARLVRLEPENEEHAYWLEKVREEENDK